MKHLITINEIDVDITVIEKETYISLTDMVKAQNGDKDTIGNWMRLRNTIEYMGVWEIASGNKSFKLVEFEEFKYLAGSNNFSLSPQRWIEATNAGGIISKSGRYGGTWAHEEIALEFATWLSPTFKVYVVKEYNFFKKALNQPLNDDWHLKRRLASINYTLHTEAIKTYLIKHPDWKENLVYASEADVLNVAAFGMTAKEWRDQNPDKKGNIRDHAQPQELVILSNLEVLNAEFLQQGIEKQERLFRLHNSAHQQLLLISRKKLLG
jgi:KilA-N domain